MQLCTFYNHQSGRNQFVDKILFNSDFHSFSGHDSLLQKRGDAWQSNKEKGKRWTKIDNLVENGSNSILSSPNDLQTAVLVVFKSIWQHLNHDVTVCGVCFSLVTRVSALPCLLKKMSTVDAK